MTVAAKVTEPLSGLPGSVIVTDGARLSTSTSLTTAEVTVVVPDVATARRSKESLAKDVVAQVQPNGAERPEHSVFQLVLPAVAYWMVTTHGSAPPL